MAYINGKKILTIVKGGGGGSTIAGVYSNGGNLKIYTSELIESIIKISGNSKVDYVTGSHTLTSNETTNEQTLQLDGKFKLTLGENGSVTVEKLEAENVKKGVNILGVTGTFECSEEYILESLELSY